MARFSSRSRRVNSWRADYVIARTIDNIMVGEISISRPMRYIVCILFLHARHLARKCRGAGEESAAKPTERRGGN